jgi:exopolyphosphatase / guanosine-5'-triphosphate,3'-diphosphate pyrophosphatase
MYFIIQLAVFTFASAFAQPDTDPSCIVRRAAFDIGSSSTKLQVADVNQCSQKIIKTILTEKTKVDYKEDLKVSGTGAFSDKVLSEGRAAIEKLYKKAKDAGAVSFAGVGTEAFRNAKNGQSYLSEFEKKVPITVITQREEAILGYFGGVAKNPSNQRDQLVWDIGGGSMQITTSDDPSRYHIFAGKTASKGFKDLVLNQILNRNPSEHKSPNPIGPENIEVAIKLAERSANNEVSAEMKEQVKARKNKVLGIGGVLFDSISKRIEKTDYTQEDLRQAILKLASMDDQALGGSPYVDSEVTNLILVLGYMKALEIPSVKALDVNLTDGLLVNSKYYAESAIQIQSQLKDSPVTERKGKVFESQTKDPKPIEAGNPALINKSNARPAE